MFYGRMKVRPLTDYLIFAADFWLSRSFCPSGLKARKGVRSRFLLMLLCPAIFPGKSEPARDDRGEPNASYGKFAGVVAEAWSFPYYNLVGCKDPSWQRSS
jgi:hypothetical protein